MLARLRYISRLLRFPTLFRTLGRNVVLEDKRNRGRWGVDICGSTHVPKMGG